MKLTKNRPKTCCRWRSVLTTLLVAVGMLTASAQTQTLTGSVTDAADGEPLMGATIKVKETNAGVVTDLDGHYAVKVDNGQTLVVSYIGYITKSVKYTGQATLDVALSADNAALDEVVVVGYGVMKRSDITGSVVSVGEKEVGHHIGRPGPARPCCRCAGDAELRLAWRRHLGEHPWRELAERQ